MGYYVRIITEMGCCGCFGFPRKPKSSEKIPPKANVSEQLLLDEDIEDDCDYYSDNEEHLDTATRSDSEPHFFGSRIEDIVSFRKQNGLICREFPVKETHVVVRTEDEDGNKMVNEYVRERKIGSGSYGKVVLYRNRIDGKYYAVKAFHKSHLLKLRVAPSETAMTDVLREVSIMKMSDHPNIVNLVEVIDDPNSDNFYMVLEYVEGKWSCESAGLSGRLGESSARKYLRDIISGLSYLHLHNVVHGDIKPDNLLVTSTGIVKIADFSVSQVFEDDNDVLRRSPGTPVFTAPECCLGLTYHGKVADTWAVGVTLYFMVLGRYPFLGETLQDTYDKIVNCPLWLPHDMEPQLKDLLTGLLNKDPKLRLTLGSAANHGWVTANEGPIPSYLCWCKRAKPNGIVTVKF